jgi:hypothetical protein
MINFEKQVLKHIEKIKGLKKMKSYLDELSYIENGFYNQIQLIKKAEQFALAMKDNTPYEPAAEEKDESRLEILSGAAPKKTKVKAEKKEKVDSKKLSYDLFKSGLTIQEVAKERDFAVTTIEGHLAYYVSLGLLNVKDFVKAEKLEKIRQAYENLGSGQFGPIKQLLGEAYSYSEIRFAIGFLENANKHTESVAAE